MPATRLCGFAVIVNGFPGELLISHNPETAGGILWTDDNNTAFYISAFLDNEELIKLAESVEKIKGYRTDQSNSNHENNYNSILSPNEDIDNGEVFDIKSGKTIRDLF